MPSLSPSRRREPHHRRQLSSSPSLISSSTSHPTSMAPPVPPKSHANPPPKYPPHPPDPVLETQPTQPNQKSHEKDSQFQSGQSDGLDQLMEGRKTKSCCALRGDWRHAEYWYFADLLFLLMLPLSNSSSNPAFPAASLPVHRPFLLICFFPLANPLFPSKPRSKKIPKSFFFSPLCGRLTAADSDSAGQELPNSPYPSYLLLEIQAPAVPGSFRAGHASRLRRQHQAASRGHARRRTKVQIGPMKFIGWNNRDMGMRLSIESMCFVAKLIHSTKAQGAFSHPEIATSCRLGVDGHHLVSGTGASGQVPDQDELVTGGSSTLLHHGDQLGDNMDYNWAMAPAHKAPRAP